MIQDGDRQLLLSCDGDVHQPNSVEVARLREIWNDRERYFEAARDFLRDHETDRLSRAKLSTPYGISIEHWNDADCVIEMLDPDRETVWRVGFRDNAALYHAFDH